MGKKVKEKVELQVQDMRIVTPDGEEDFKEVLLVNGNPVNENEFTFGLGVGVKHILELAGLKVGVLPDAESIELEAEKL